MFISTQIAKQVFQVVSIFIQIVKLLLAVVVLVNVQDVQWCAKWGPPF